MAWRTIAYWAVIMGPQTISPSQPPRGDCRLSRWSRARSHAAGALEVLLPLANGELLEEGDGGIEVGHGQRVMRLVRLLLGLHRLAVLPEQGRDEQPVGGAEQRRHERARDGHARERHPQRLEVEEKVRPRGALVDRQVEGPVRDPAGRE